MEDANRQSARRRQKRRVPWWVSGIQTTATLHRGSSEGELFSLSSCVFVIPAVNASHECADCMQHMEGGSRCTCAFASALPLHVCSVIALFKGLCLVRGDEPFTSTSRCVLYRRTGTGISLALCWTGQIIIRLLPQHHDSLENTRIPTCITSWPYAHVRPCILIGGAMRQQRHNPTQSEGQSSANSRRQASAPTRFAARREHAQKGDRRSQYMSD